MKAWFNIAIQLGNIALVTFQPQVAGWLGHHPGVTTAVAGIIGIIAHFYNPDGTPASASIPAEVK